MSNIRLCVTFVAAFLLAVNVQVRAATDVEVLVGKLAQITSMSGQFEQVLLDETGETIESSRGQFVLQKPGRFYWLTTEPFEQELISDGETIWLYDPDLFQVTVREVSEAMDKSPAHLLSANAATLSKTYQVERQGQNEFTLTPKEPQALFDTLVIGFDDNSVGLIRLNDALGQSTVITLADTQLNQPVDASQFQFVVPQDVDVLVD
ncbi:outer membrane lipoprotein chaperone LolA [Gilvimarinus sp. 1_MG-2023]|uniref:outer membrane lipoprotein chaperone LolA n=1 Tax=Gilvimarinus sp. 1_MG-2023 TaxID=3062638 RepID=UPI0026E42F17|nr:outer membrane lipoprotein chaperone LolA [Gilvimarinus sp. 1_MG-2023]MDO6745652.1 outer membrane lipoprotein chaperone LolA [Gilvimarinus sp. 1_MG-2023]